MLRLRFPFNQLRRISIKETRIQEAVLVERRASGRDGKTIKVTYPAKNDRLSVLERARSSLQMAISKKDLLFAQTQFDILEADLDLVTTYQLVDYLNCIVTKRVVNSAVARDNYIESLATATQLLEEIVVRNEIVPPLDTIYSLLEQLAANQDGQRIELILELLVRNNVYLNNHFVEVLLRYYARNGPVESAEKLIEYCIDKKLGTSITHFSLLIDAYANSKKPWKIMDTIKMAEDLGHPTTTTLLLRGIRAFGAAREYSGVQSLVALMKARNISRSPDYFQTLLQAYKNIGKKHLMVKTFADMKEEMEPTMKSYSIMMDMFAKAGMASRAADILQSAVASDKIQPDAVMFNTVINGFRMEKNIDEVTYFYTLMQNCGLRIPIDTYNIMIAAYGHNGHLALAEHVYNDMNKAGIIPDRRTLGTMLSIYVSLNHFEEAKKYFALIQARGMTPSAVILSNMIQVSAAEITATKSPAQKALLFDTGLAYFRLAVHLNILELQACVETANLYLVGGNLPLLKVIDIIMTEMAQANVKPSYEVAAVFAKHILLQGPLALIPARTSYNALVSSLGKIELTKSNFLASAMQYLS